MPSWARLTSWLLFLGGAVLALVALGRGALATPSVLDPGAWGAWAQLRDPLVVVLAGLRLLALAVAWYLVGVTLIGVAARLLRSAQLLAAADLLTVPAVRRLLQGALGVGLATAAVVSAGSTAVPTAPAARALSGSATPIMLQPLAPEAPLVLEPLPDPAPSRDTPRKPAERREHVAVIPSPGPGDPEPVAEAPDRSPAPDEWVISAGEHLWAVAEAALTRGLDRRPTEAEVESYWRVLIDENQARLLDPSNPDLVYPGQRFVLPEASG